MPLKSYRGYNTGNTLKRWSSALGNTHGAGPRADADGVLHVLSDRRGPLQLDDLEFAPGVTYSLKKKQRWRLREYVRARLADTDGPLADASVELAEGGRDERGTARADFLLRRAAGSDEVRQLGRARGHLNRRSAATAMARAEEPAPGAAGERPREVVFEFVRPPAHRSAFQRLCSRAHSAPKWSHGRAAAGLADFPWPADLLQIGLEARQQARADEMEDAEEPGDGPPGPQLADFLVPKPEKAPRRRRRNCKSDSSDEGRPSRKDRKVIEAAGADPASDSESDSDSDADADADADAWMELDAGTEPPSLPTWRLRFRAADLRPAALATAFGEAYEEGRSEPRKLALRVAGGGFLVLEEVSTAGDECECDVLLNADPPAPPLAPAPGAGPQDLRALVARAEALLEGRPAPPPEVRYPRAPRPLSGPAPRPVAPPAAADDGWEVVDDDWELVDPACGGCGHPVRPPVGASSRPAAEAAALGPGAALRCGHLHCGRCWARALLAGAACPRPGCDEPADAVTRLRFLPLGLGAGAGIACPRAGCGGAVRVDRPPPGALNVACACGATFCFACRADAHWPAPCAAHAAYLAKLRRLGDAPAPPDPARPRLFCAAVRWRAARLGRGHAHDRLDAGALREALLRARKRRGREPTLALREAREEAARVVRRFEELLRLAEFAHVAALALLRPREAPGPLLRDCAQRLAGLAAAICDAVAARRPLDVLHHLFRQARDTVAVLHSLPALRDPARFRRAL